MERMELSQTHAHNNKNDIKKEIIMVECFKVLVILNLSVIGDAFSLISQFYHQRFSVVEIFVTEENYIN